MSAFARRPQPRTATEAAALSPWGPLPASPCRQPRPPPWSFRFAPVVSPCILGGVSRESEALERRPPLGRRRPTVAPSVARRIRLISRRPRFTRTLAAFHVKPSPSTMSDRTTHGSLGCGSRDGPRGRPVRTLQSTGAASPDDPTGDSTDSGIRQPRPRSHLRWIGRGSEDGSRAASRQAGCSEPSSWTQRAAKLDPASRQAGPGMGTGDDCPVWSLVGILDTADPAVRSVMSGGHGQTEERPS